MSTSIVTNRKPPREALRDLEQVVVQGNLATLSENERIGYYARVCESLGLNPLTRPFEYITLNGKLTLYARKDATDQLRDIHGVSIPLITAEKHPDDGLFVVIAQAEDRYGRKDSGMGVVSIAGLKGENLANAMMKAETKAKRRATLSICGLGWMDEVEALDLVPSRSPHAQPWPMPLRPAELHWNRVPVRTRPRACPRGRRSVRSPPPPPPRASTRPTSGLPHRTGSCVPPATSS